LRQGPGRGAQSLAEARNLAKRGIHEVRVLLSVYGSYGDGRDGDGGHGYGGDDGHGGDDGYGAGRGYGDGGVGPELLP